MAETLEALAQALRDRVPGARSGPTIAFGEVTVEVAAAELLDTARVLIEDPALRFRQLTDLCVVDYLSYGKADWEDSEKATGSGFSRAVAREEYAEAHHEGPRFAVIYHLLSHEHNERMRLRVYPEGEPPRVDSVVELWPSADWFEREAFDLFGVLFDGHSDLRRILTDYGFIGHPFRKDFPLIGQVEMRYDPERQRVAYQPVSIEPRTLVPRVIRHDNRYETKAPGSPADDSDA